MKVCSTRLAYWTFALGIVLTVNGIVAQESSILDPVALCNDQRTPDCEWLESNRKINELNELLKRLTDGDNGQKYRVRNHVAPRYAPYDQGRDVVQYPFASNWRNQPNWSAKSTKLQGRQPFNYDNKRGMKFSSWGGKRNGNDLEDQMNNKRDPAFSSWGGKRTQKFFNWGGKRSIPENEVNDVDTYEHNIMKRNASPELKTEKREKRTCITDEMNLQELFKEFIDWSRKQPEQKKGSMYRRMFSVSTLHSPDNLSRRAGSFFPWGGKRNAKQN